MTTPITPPNMSTEIVITEPEGKLVLSPIRWSAIFAAAVVATSAWLLLHLFGIGVGLTAIDPDDFGSVQSVGIGTGIWSLIAPILALFVGGLVAGRVAPTIGRLNAAIHGAVVWGLTSIVSFSFVVMMLGAMIGGASQATISVAGAAGAPISQLDRVSPGAVGLDANTLLGPINQRLQAEGMPRVKPEEISTIVREAVQSAVRNGDIDRATLIDIVARNTALTRAEAERVATEVERELASATARGRSAVTRAGHMALQAAESTGKVVLTISFMMLLTLGAAVGGSILGAGRERRHHITLPRATTAP
jgi:hypothetical protein